MTRVKMKVGRDAARRRARAAARRHRGWRRAVRRRQRRLHAQAGARHGRGASPSSVTWFEEPVSSDDLAGLRLLRERAPPGMAISAGEYGYDASVLPPMLEAERGRRAAGRCHALRGLTGFHARGRAVRGVRVPLSSHCAPALHVAACCCAGTACTSSGSTTTQRIERLLFDGAPQPVRRPAAPRPRAPARPGLQGTRRRMEYAL
jgi:L-alanine-DL-glutamate epimerase-like enolase superfamily enzyme